MATTNRAVNVYLPKELEQSITKYCTGYGITRKDKEGNISPAWGTAILEILKRYFSEDEQSNLQSIVPSNLLDEQIESIKEEVRFDLIPEFNELLKVNLQQLRERIEVLERMAIAQGAEEQEAQVEVTPQSEAETVKEEERAEPAAVEEVVEEAKEEVTKEVKPEAITEEAEVTVATNELGQPEVVEEVAIANDPKPIAQFSDGITITGAALAKRLGRDAGSITRHHQKGDLPEWSKELDPDGISWERRGKLYFPVSDAE